MFFDLRRFTSVRLRWVAILSLLLGLVLLLNGQVSANSSPFFSLNLNLDDGAIVTPTYFLNSGERDFNFSIAVSGTGSISVELENSSSQTLWSNSVSADEASWGTATFTAGQNDILITHNDDGAVEMTIQFFDLPELGDSGYSWAGTAASLGVNSEITAVFNQSGLYTFDTSANSGRFQFVANDNHIRKTVEPSSSDNNTFYIPAGTHTFTIEQDDNADTDWAVDISAAGAAADSLPYTKTGGDIGGLTNDFDQEYLPLHLSTAAAVNLALSVTGAADDVLDLSVLGSPTQLGAAATLSDVAGDETVWATVNLPAGTSYLMLDATADAALSYSLTVEAISSPTADFAGLNNDEVSPNSTMRIRFPNSGLYQFDMTVNGGEYQFQLEDEFILKTATSSNSVTYYVPAGTHEASIIQAEAADGGADWELDITAVSTTNDTLPYTKMGGNLGGTDSDFDTEWLPIALGTAQQVNLNLALSGTTLGDAISIDVYQDGSTTPDSTITAIAQGEDVWQTFPLSAGVNRLALTTDGGNSDNVTYDLEISAVPTVSSELTWSGISEDTGLNATATLNFPTAGLYRFSIDSEIGAANIVLLDGALASPAGAPTPIESSYDIQVSAGQHEVQIVQDDAFGGTIWKAAVEPVTAVSSFFIFDATLEMGETISQIYPQTGNARDFNFEVSVTGGSVQVDIENASSSTVWSDSILDGEMTWGTGTLSSGDNSIIFTHLSGAPVISLIMHDLPTAGTDFIGASDSAGVNSNMRVIFPQSGLYTFDNSVNSGSYHLTINDDFIQKTVEIDGPVTYYIPAGTHELAVEQNSTTGAEWELDISNAGAANNTLPYIQSGTLGGPDNDTNTEYLTINLGAARSVNGGIALTGTDGDVATLITLDSSDNAIMTHTVYANEALSFTMDLPAGLNRFMLEADAGNADTLTYGLGLEAIQSPSYTWEGSSHPDGENSNIRINFPTSDLYTFNFGATTGSYQFIINEEFVQKTVGGVLRGGLADTTYYIPAGTHQLYIDQDSTVGATWSLTISSADSSLDELSFVESGNMLGGMTDFDTEWLPLNLGAERKVNLQIDALGNTDDSLSITVHPLASDTVIDEIATVYGTESLITSFTVPASGVRFAIQADGGNGGTIDYNFEVSELLDVTSLTDNTVSWSGVSLYNGLNSLIEWETFVSGTYSITASSPDGFFAPIVDADATIRPTAPNFDTEFTIDLDEGPHTFTIDQADSDFFAQTTWTLTATLMMADAPVITAVSPNTAADNTNTTITIDGSNFMAGAAVTMSNGSDSVTVTNVTVVSGNQITAVIPSGSPLGNLQHHRHQSRRSGRHSSRRHRDLPRRNAHLPAVHLYQLTFGRDNRSGGTIGQ